jgi:hypothetical protein
MCAIDPSAVDEATLSELPPEIQQEITRHMGMGMATSALRTSSAPSSLPSPRSLASPSFSSSSCSSSASSSSSSFSLPPSSSSSSNYVPVVSSSPLSSCGVDPSAVDEATLSELPPEIQQEIRGQLAKANNVETTTLAHCGSAWKKSNHAAIFSEPRIRNKTKPKSKPKSKSKSTSNKKKVSLSKSKEGGIASFFRPA